MKRFSLQSMIVLAALSFAVKAGAQAHITNVTAAELAMHRVEKLVQLKKIEADFETKVKGFILTNYNPGNTTDPYFKAALYQYPAQDGTSKAVEIYLDHMGKALSFNVVAGGAASGYPTWTGKDPVTLIETALHFIENNADSMKELAPYRDELRSFYIVPAKDANNKDVALIGVAIDSSTKVLKILVNLDGKFNSYVIE